MSEDDVVPFRFMDEYDVYQKIAMEVTYRFDDVLDSDQLKSALQRLLQIGEWRSLGARLRKNAAGKLEYHIPKQYSSERPGFAWSEQRLEQRISEHPLASQIPTAQEVKRPTLFPSADLFHDLVTSPGHATDFSGWADTDLPALSIHVVGFEDATLLTLSWSHVFLDAMGRQSLLEAWVAVLNGREEDIPPFMPFRVDPATEISKGGDPKLHDFYHYALSGFWFFLFVLGYMYEMVVHSAEAGRMICCPGPWVENLRQQAIADVLANGHEDKDLFLSHGDVLLAWWAKVSVAAQNLSPSQPINIMNVINFRGMFPDHLPNTDDAAYVGNAVSSTYTFVTSGELARISVGDLALRLRQDLQKQRRPEQIRHLLAWQRESRELTGRQPLVGKWNTITVGWSNWHRARFFDLDFSAAALQPGKPLENRANRLGQPSCILPNGHANGFSLRNAGPLIGRDANGDWWMQIVLRKDAWSRVGKQFERL